MAASPWMLAAVGAFRVVPEHDLDLPRDTLDNLHHQRLVQTLELGDGERGLGARSQSAVLRDQVHFPDYRIEYEVDGRELHQRRRLSRSRGTASARDGGVAVTQNTLPTERWTASASSWRSQNASCRAHQTCGSKRRSTTSSDCNCCSSRRESRSTEIDSIEPPQRHRFSTTWRRLRVLMKRW